MLQMPERLLTLKEAAERLGRSRSWIYQQRRFHKLEFPIIRRGSVLGVREQTLNEYIARGKS